MKLKNYFAFENAVESIKYYEDNFAGKLIQHMPVPESMKEQLNIDSVEGSTFSASMKIFEQDFQFSDRFDFEEGFTGNFNVLIEFASDEGKKFDYYIDVLKNVECIYSNVEEKEVEYKMYRVRDKYGIIWSLIMTL